MENFKLEELEIKIAANGDNITMKWLGRSESRNPSENLNPYIDGIIGESSGKKIEIDFCELQYMNSSTVPPIIRLVKTCSEKGIPATVFFNQGSEWQSASFKPLKVVCTTLKNISVEGK